MRDARDQTHRRPKPAKRKAARAHSGSSGSGDSSSDSDNDRRRVQRDEDDDDDDDDDNDTSSKHRRKRQRTASTDEDGEEPVSESTTSKIVQVVQQLAIAGVAFVAGSAFTLATTSGTGSLSTFAGNLLSDTAANANSLTPFL